MENVNVIFENGKLRNISAKVEISNLENLGWNFDNIYEGVSSAKDISIEKAETWEKENYHVKLEVSKEGVLTYSLCQNAEYGNEEFNQGDCGDNESGLKDFRYLIKNNEVWDLKYY